MKTKLSMGLRSDQYKFFKRSKRGISFLNFSLFLIILAVLMVPFWLEPAIQGLGTHQQLGLPACPWWTYLHIKCPTCGLTTSFTWLTSGQLSESFASHLLGPLLYGFLSLLGLLLLAGTFFPRWLGRLFLLKEVRFVIDVGLVLFVIQWVYTLSLNNSI